MKKLFLILFAAGSFVSHAQQEFGDGLYATFKTDKGDIIVKFTPEQTPLTVSNFISLAEGTQTKSDKKYHNKPFFNGLKFHRVINDFMIQGGDPLGDGSGSPGYYFPDEIVTELKHDKPGILSMANRGPATNGSQFFITHKATPWLDGKHTVFGHVVKGQDIVNAIEQGDAMKEVVITRVGKNYQKYKAEKVFAEKLSVVEKAEEERKAKAEEERKKIEADVKRLADKANAVTAEQLKAKIAENEVKFKSISQKAMELPSGLKIFVYEKGKGGKPVDGETVFVDYAGYLENGTLFDSGMEETAAEYKIFNVQRKTANAYAPIKFTYGQKVNLIQGFAEGVMHLNKGDKAILVIPPTLGYGEYGVGAIPGNATLFFDIHLLNK